MTVTEAVEAPRLRTFHDAEDALARSLPGYESRAPQQALARSIEDVFGNDANFAEYDVAVEDYRDWERPGVSHLFGQAGCGTGKSLAYLIPSILSGRRVVVSVTTKSLQDQIVASDLPFLEEHLGQPFSWALLKGRSNYLCVNRLTLLNEAEVGGDREEARDVLKALWAAVGDPEFDGLRESVGRDVPQRIWGLACSDPDECSDCKSNEDYAQRARANAASANLVIVNHALFCTDLVLKSLRGGEGMLGTYDLVVFDEAHALEDVAGNTLGGSLSEATFASFSAQVHNWGAQYDDAEGSAFSEPLTDLGLAARALFDKIEVGRLRTGQINDLVEEFGAVYDALSATHQALRKATYENSSDPVRAKKKRWRCWRLAVSLLDRLGETIAAPATEVVRWVEEETRRRGSERVKVIKIAPILVAPFLNRWLYSKTPAIHVSATLAVRGDMGYVAGRLGVPSYGQIDVGTPFDFARQGRLYVPVVTPSGQPFPAPQGNQLGTWEGMALHEIHRLCTASRGRALVLFTSIKHMRSTFESIKRMGGDLAYRMQGEAGASNADLVAWLKGGVEGQPGRVLFGTKSFFTGIDVQGDALSLLIITKMPFPVHTDPLHEARGEAIELAGGSSFADYSVPMMSLELQQGIGRLIRHRGDRGVAAILDPRIVNKGYGKSVLRDLPPMPQTFKVDDVAEFFGAAS